jgi:uncharacterized protein (DUF433 family)
MLGAVCFRGTRTPVSIVLENLAARDTSEAILAEFLTLRAEHLSAAIGCAADLAPERILPVPTKAGN